VNEIVSRIYGYARAAWRRRWWGLVATWVVAVTAWALVMSLPDRFEASSQVFVDARTPLSPVLQGIAVDGGYESKVALVREALLSRPQLEAVATKTGLFDTKKESPEEVEQLLVALKERIVVSSAAPEAPGSQSNNTIYTISYQHTDPAKSVEVVQTLLDNFVDGTRSSDRTGAVEVQTFVTSQIADLEKRLQSSEVQLAAFRKNNLGLIPGERGDYFTRLEQEMSSLQTADTNLAVAVSRRDELRRQLNSARVYIPGTTAGSSGNQVTGSAPDVTVRRQEAEQRLEELLLRFTDSHPEVIAVRQNIIELKSRETKELAELQKGGMGSGAIRSLSVNPVYQQIQTQINQAQVDIASIQGAATQHRQEISNLRKLVDRAPEIEQEYARLNREYTVTREQFQQMVQRREQTRISDDAATSGIVRFDVIEPPRAALEPVWPKRTLLVLVGLFFGILSGIAAMILPHLFAPTYDDTHSLERDLDLPVLGSVTTIRSSKQDAIERLEIRSLAMASFALIALAGLLMAFGGAGARLLHGLFA
jgi:polysaccharide chain length determinant protein (PEP-CTERM system associated)